MDLYSHLNQNLLHKRSTESTAQTRFGITSVSNRAMSLIGITAFMWLTDLRMSHSIRSKSILKLRGHANYNVGVKTPIGNVVYTNPVTQHCEARPQSPWSL